MHFDTEARIFKLSNWHNIQLCDKFSSIIFICLTPFSQLQFGLIGCMISAMKMGNRHFYGDYSNGC